jgi:hypothetical protein
MTMVGGLDVHRQQITRDYVDNDGLVHWGQIRPATRAPARSLYRAPCATWWSTRVRGSRTAAASSCLACPAPGNCWRSIRHGARAGSAEAELASMPTPGRRTAMRRSDRAVEVIARRTPWILRGMARLAPAADRR